MERYDRGHELKTGKSPFEKSEIGKTAVKDRGARDATIEDEWTNN